ncbi:MAG: SPFH domain-containing protein [Limisphaerales bacterium]
MSSSSAASTSTYIVQPGYRGIEVTLGKVSPVFKPEGFGFKTPLIANIVPVTIRQQTRDLAADCYSSDLQQVKTELRVLYRIPEASVVQIYQGYAGDPFDSLIAPRVQEALKEVTAMQSAEQIVKNREDIKPRRWRRPGSKSVRCCMWKTSLSRILIFQRNWKSPSKPNGAGTRSGQGEVHTAKKPDRG